MIITWTYGAIDQTRGLSAWTYSSQGARFPIGPTIPIAMCLDAGGKRSYPGAGTTWYDMSGNENNGTLTSGPTFDPANGGSIDFDGSDDYVSVGNNASLNFGTNQDFSIELWFNTTQRDSSGKEMIQKQDGGVFYQIRGPISGQSDKIRVQIDDDTTQTSLYSETTNLDDGNWHDVVVVRDYGNTLYMYIDGAEDNTVSDSTGSIDDNDEPLIVGAGGGSDNVIDTFFDGRIASVRIYNSALTAAEVRQNYNATKGRFI